MGTLIAMATPAFLTSSLPHLTIPDAVSEGGAMAEERPPRLVDYFVIAGLAGNGAPIPEETWVPEPSGPLRPPRPAEPITDVAVIARALGEEVPQGYTCIQASTGGHPLELSAGLLGGTQPVICYRRGRDKPPLVELGCVHLPMLAPGEAGRRSGEKQGHGMREVQWESEESGLEAREKGLKLCVLNPHTDLGLCTSAAAG